MRSASPLLLKLLLALAAVLAAVPVAAQGRPARLDVAVMDSMDRPVAGTRIVVSGSPAPGITDSAGNATVQRIAPGSRLVSIRYPGYREERALLDFAPGAEIAIRVVLTPEPIALDTVTATGQRFVLALHHAGFYKRRRQGLGRFMDRADLARVERAGGDLCVVMRRLPGFRVVGGYGPGTQCSIESARGGSFIGTCRPEIRINGIVADMDQFNILVPQHVEAIEAYATDAEVPAEYSGNSMCGAILIWLRR